VTARARARAGSPGWAPVRRFPMSTSTRTLTTTPAALAAVPMAATFSEWSTTIIVSGASATSFMSLAIDVGGTISVVINSPRMPAAAITSASPSLAQATPSAPAWIWRFAISGHLWVLA